jgi:hypothetical protein
MKDFTLLTFSSYNYAPNGTIQNQISPLLNQYQRFPHHVWQQPASHLWAQVIAVHKNQLDFGDTRDLIPKSLPLSSKMHCCHSQYGESSPSHQQQVQPVIIKG